MSEKNTIKQIELLIKIINNEIDAFLFLQKKFYEQEKELEKRIKICYNNKDN